MRDSVPPPPRVLKGLPLTVEGNVLRPATDTGGSIERGSLAADLGAIARAKERQRRGAHITQIMDEFHWGHARTLRVLDSPDPPQTVLDWAHGRDGKRGHSQRQLPGDWKNPLDHRNLDRTYSTPWADDEALIEAYAEWAEDHGREPRPSDWERADPAQRRPTRRTVDGRTNWRHLVRAGRAELRARGREDLVDG
jgi:hypothetical protein